MESSWFWRIFLGLAVLSDLMGGGQMMLRQEQFLGDAAASGSASLFLTLSGIFLFLFAGLTCLILGNPARYWPLAWFAAFGRGAAGCTMLYYWYAALVPEDILGPAVMDLAFGIGFCIYAFRHTTRSMSRTGQWK